MTGNEDIASKIAETLDVATKCTTAETSDNYSVLKERLEELDSMTRRAFLSHANYKSLLDKLQKGGALTDDEQRTLRALIVGEADYYMKYDDDFARSKSELGKILDETRKLQTGELDPDDLTHLGVLCREACSALIPAAHYLTQKESVGKFEAATKGPIDQGAGQALVGIIKNMMSN